jgi:hypothetical protein
MLKLESLTLRAARTLKRHQFVVGACIVALRARMTHSYNHKRQYTAEWLNMQPKYPSIGYTMEGGNNKAVSQYVKKIQSMQK